MFINRAFKINNTKPGYENDVKNIKATLQKNMFPTNLLSKLSLKLKDQFNEDSEKEITVPLNKRYFKLPYIGKYSEITQHNINKIIKKYCKLTTQVRLAFTTFKIQSLFSTKDPIPNNLKSFLVYKFTCASCNACYIGETTRHFRTRIDEHTHKDKNSHIYKHLNGNPNCLNSLTNTSFTYLDSANTSFQLKLKEGMHIGWEKPNLNKQVNHIATTLSI